MATAAPKFQLSTALPDSQPVPIDTRVFGSDETGVTYVDEKGRGLFIPDSSTALPRLGRTKTVAAATDANVDNSPSISALYPHFADPTAKAPIGETLNLVNKAVDDLQRILEASCDEELETLNFLMLAEAQLFQAVNSITFNKAFDSVVSYCAWGLRNVNLSKISPPSLQGMCSVLRELHEHPFVSMERATRLLLDLESQGWVEKSYLSDAFDIGLATFDSENGAIFE